MEPHLSPTDRLLLPDGARYRLGNALRGDEFDLAPNAEFDQDFLEAAVRSGFVPNWEGIDLAAHGYFLYNRALIEEMYAAGACGDTDGPFTMSGFYRGLAECLLQEADALEALQQPCDRCCECTRNDGGPVETHPTVNLCGQRSGS